MHVDQAGLLQGNGSGWQPEQVGGQPTQIWFMADQTNPSRELANQREDVSTGQESLMKLKHRRQTSTHSNLSRFQSALVRTGDQTIDLHTALNKGTGHSMRAALAPGGQRPVWMIEPIKTLLGNPMTQ